MKGNSALTTQKYFLYKYQNGHIHFLHVATVHKPALNYNTIITNVVERLAYIHANTKLQQKHATFDITKRRLP